jgi:hypothetical protein
MQLSVELPLSRINLDLPRIVGNDLRRAPILSDLTRHADAFPFVLVLRRPELAPVLAPDQHREHPIDMAYRD